MASIDGLVSAQELHDVVFGQTKHWALEPKDYFLRACQYLLSRQLRSVCYANGREKDGDESAPVICQLAMVYRFRSPEKLSLVKSAALLNAAAQRRPGNLVEIRADLVDLCNHVLQLAGAVKNENLVDRTDYFYSLIEAMRDNVKNQLREMDQLNKSCTEVRDKEQREAKKFELTDKIQTYVTEQYLKVMREIMEFCIELKGEPPCKYALVGMGSLARNEITPYSDFESIIVLEEGVQSRKDYDEILEYFRWVSVIFQIILVNFGETIIPFLCIEGLNDPYKKEDNWFYDACTCCGISPDGFAPHASKNPLGRQKTQQKSWLTELIKPVSGMLQFLETSEDLKNGYHLADILLRTCFVEGNVEVYDDFSAGVASCRRQVSDSEQFRREVMEDLENFDVNARMSSVQLRERFDLKRTVFRSVTLFTTALGRYHELETAQSHETVAELERKSIIDSNFAHRLRMAISTACETRIKMYMESGGQDDQVFWDALRYNPAGSELLAAVEVDDLASLFRTSKDLQRFVKESMLEVEEEGSGQEERDMDTDSLDPSHEETDKQYFKVITCMVLGLYEQTSEECEKYLHMLHEPSIRLEWGKAMLAHSLYRIGRYQTALANCEDFLKEKETVVLLAISGECLLGMGLYAEALVRLERSLAMLPADDRHDDMLKADCLFRTGECLFRLDLYSPALEYFSKAKGIYTDKGLSATVADCLDMEGKSLYNLGQIESALASFSDMLNTQKRITEDETHDEQIATALNFKYLCLVQLDRWEEADAYKRDELDIHENILESYDDTSDTNNVAIPLEMLFDRQVAVAKCLADLGRQEDAAECRRNAVLELEVHVNVLGETEGLEIVRLLRKCHVELNEYDKAVEMFKAEIEFLEKTNGKENSRLDLADVFHLYGKFLETSGNKTEAMDAYKNEIAELNAALDASDKLRLKIGKCYMALGEYKNAVDTFEKQLDNQLCSPQPAFTLGSSTNDKELAFLYRSIALAEEKIFNYERALHNYKLELCLRQRLRENIGESLPVADCLIQISYCHFQMQNVDEAARCFRDSVNISDSAPTGTLSSTIRFLGHFGIAKCLSVKDEHEASLAECILAVSTLIKSWQDRSYKTKANAWLRDIGLCTTLSGKLACYRKHRSALFDFERSKPSRLVECLDLIEQTLIATVG